MEFFYPVTFVKDEHLKVQPPRSCPIQSCSVGSLDLKSCSVGSLLSRKAHAAFTLKAECEFLLSDFIWTFVYSEFK